MKLFKILGHPIVVIIVFLFLLISGEQFGGFYLIYLLLGLPKGAPHAIIAVIGILSMLAGFILRVKQFNSLKPLFCITGSLLFIIALIVFFKGSKGYNSETFHQGLPILTFVLLGLCIISNLLLSASMLINRNIPRNYSFQS